MKNLFNVINMKKSEFAVNVLREYAKESGNIMVRSTSDLSPLEEWLIIKMYQKQIDAIDIAVKMCSEEFTRLKSHGRWAYVATTKDFSYIADKLKKELE